MNFINFSNHPSRDWSPEELAAAREWGPVKDLKFPALMPEYGKNEIILLADKYTRMILDMEPSAVLCQGESTLMFAVIGRLQTHGIKVVAACSRRDVMETIGPNGETVKQTIFRFVRFREYERLEL